MTDAEIAHIVIGDLNRALDTAFAEIERLRAIVVAQGEAIEHQRNHNHNVEQKRGNWRKKAEAWRACADQLAARLQVETRHAALAKATDEALTAYEQLKATS